MEQKIIIDNLSTKDGLIENYKTSINGIQLLNSFPHDMILDIRYASKNNFTKKVLYDADIALIHEETLKKLLNAQEEFKSLGYKIKLWDAYRPFYIQKILWDIVPNNNYIANPYKGGSNHNRACAVDITLTDLNGNEIDMPTGFDEFSEKSHRSYTNASAIQIKNAEFLKNIMTKHGFSPIYTEWWHFDDTNYLNYPIINISHGEYLKIVNDKIERRWNFMKINVSKDTCELLKAQLEKKSKKYVRLHMAGFGWGGPAFSIVLDEQIKDGDIKVEVNEIIFLVNEEFEEFLDDSTVLHSKSMFGTSFKVSSKHSSC